MQLFHGHVLFGAGRLKTTRPGNGITTLKFKAYAPDRRLCVLTYLREYLKRTKPFRKGKSALFLSYRKPLKPVSKDTLARWIRTVLFRAGISPSFKAHSTRSAAVSAAFGKNVPIDDILKTAGWSTAGTFAKFYNKSVATSKEFADAVLEN